MPVPLVQRSPLFWKKSMLVQVHRTDTATILTKSKTFSANARSSVFCIRGLPLNNLLSAATAIDTCHGLTGLMDRRQGIAASTHFPVFKSVKCNTLINVLKLSKATKLRNANPV
jgi:hypothetical protein